MQTSSSGDRSNALEKWIAAKGFHLRSPSLLKIRPTRCDAPARPESCETGCDLLEFFGLVNVREEINPGHGRKRVIEPHAVKYQLIATI
jgi:hypothetical protein